MKGVTPVSYEEARARVLEYLATRTGLASASQISHVIWPGHKMSAQGSGGAAARVLARMADERLVRWTTRGSGRMISWGWQALS